MAVRVGVGSGCVTVCGDSGSGVRDRDDGVSGNRWWYRSSFGKSGCGGTGSDYSDGGDSVDKGDRKDAVEKTPLQVPVILISFVGNYTKLTPSVSYYTVFSLSFVYYFVSSEIFYYF